MFTNILNLIIVVLLVIAMGCDEDLLNTPNPNEPTNESFWKTEQDAERAVNAVYSAFDHWGLYDTWAFNWLNIRADDSYADSPWSEYNVLGEFNSLSDRTSVSEYWTGLYQGIFRANQVISRVPDMDIDSDIKNRVIGEAKLLRGLFTFIL